MKQLSRIIAIVAAVIVTAYFPNVSQIAHAGGPRYIPPNYTIWLEDNEHVTVKTSSLLADLDTEKPTLKTKISVQTDEPTVLNCRIPVFDRIISVDRDYASLSFNDEEITPALSYSENIFGDYENFTYAEVMSACSDARLPENMNIPCVQYFFQIASTGEISFNVPYSAKLLTSLNNYTSHSNPRSYTLRSGMQSLVIMNDDIEIITSIETEVERKEMTYAEFLDESVTMMKEISKEMDYPPENMEQIITDSFARFLASRAILSEYDSVIFNEPFRYGYTYLKYSLNLPAGPSELAVFQPFAHAKDTLVKPEVQNFRLISSNLANVSVALKTNRVILNESNLFTKTEDGYYVSQTVPERLAIDVCESTNPVSIFPPKSSVLETWQIVLITIFGAGFVISMTIFIVLTIKEKRR